MISPLESSELADAAEAFLLAKQRCEVAFLERDNAARRLAEIVKLGNIDRRVFVLGDHVFEVNRHHDQVRCTVTRADITLPF